MAAKCIGIIFKNKEIPNQEMKREIISHLKQQLNDPELKRRKDARLALKGLALNSANKTEIQKYGFRIPEEEQDEVEDGQNDN
ncbi:MAG: hypothetical protein EZS28_040650 [Streblomastix strix]|uniref:Uncharacterized protein n=1 Tax=Streblomastix strix TaxID=222440 RepID=A0A5J4U0Q6_9EUKA|nr:MAG: hypothetical protein EZS28_040650 [Streblomastix strix]